MSYRLNMKGAIDMTLEKFIEEEKLTIKERNKLANDIEREGFHAYMATAIREDIAEHQQLLDLLMELKMWRGFGEAFGKGRAGKYEVKHSKIREINHNEY